MNTIDRRIAIILEAAGDSRRFGSNKLMHTMDDGLPMIAHILRLVDHLDVYLKILVTQYDEVAKLARGYTIVRNMHPELGISHSMQLGIEAAGDADAYMFCVCDQPYLGEDSVISLIDAYNDNPNGIVSLSCNGRMCNPKIFSSAFRDELMELSGDVGGRQIISRHMDKLVLVEAKDEKETLDIDTPLG